jgi:hypothetical protein
MADVVPFPPTAPADEGEQALENLVVALAEENAQLQRALDTRIVIEQAKGVLAERLGVELPDAFELLRGAARNNRLRLHELAARVVSSRETPGEIDVARLLVRGTRPRA